MEKLTDEQISERLPVELPEWSLLGDAITRTFQFQNFHQSMSFVYQVANVAETSAHHPDILIRFSKVSLTLSTHDAGGITDQDLDLARTLDEIAGLIVPAGT